MKTLIGVLIFCLFLPYSTSQADKASSYAVSRLVSEPAFLEISSGFSNVKLFKDEVPQIKIDHSSEVKTGIQFSIITPAEAALPPDEYKAGDFEKICNAISSAGMLDDLKPYLLGKNLEFLKAKVKGQVSSHAVLVMFQAMRPQKIRIIDSRIEGERAEFAVTGSSVWGPMQGLIHMVKADGTWKIEDESWYASKHFDRRDGLMIKGFSNLSDADQYVEAIPGDLVSRLSPDYVLKKGLLQLNKVAHDRNKRALMFVFLMDKQKVDPDRPAAVKEVARARIHVLGPKRVFPEQQVIESGYPVDISVAKYNDGYMPQACNFVLPSKKPREVAVSWMWSF